MATADLDRHIHAEAGKVLYDVCEQFGVVEHLVAIGSLTALPHGTEWNQAWNDGPDGDDCLREWSRLLSQSLLENKVRVQAYLTQNGTWLDFTRAVHDWWERYGSRMPLDGRVAQPCLSASEGLASYDLVTLRLVPSLVRTEDFRRVAASFVSA